MIGSTSVSPVKVKTIYFQIHLPYDERELEVLLEDFERRGATYTKLTDPSKLDWYELRVPASLNWIPFYRTLQDHRSVKHVHNTIMEKTIVPIESTA